MSQRIIYMVAVAAFAFVSPALAAEKELNRTFQVSPGGRLSVDIDGGSITVAGADTKQVVVRMKARGNARQLERTTMSADQNAEGVVVVSKRERDTMLDWGGSEGVNVTVEVPRSYNLELVTAGGGIDVRHVDGDVNGRTSGGQIRVASLRGKLNMRTSGGQIQLEDVKGPVEVTTSGGSIAASRIEGGLRARTNGGGIRLEKVSGAIEATTQGGSIDVELVGANEGIHAKTSAGGITLRVPRTTQATLDASTSAGSVKSELPITTTEVDKRSLRGTLNGGGPEIQARTSAGSIYITNSG